MEFLLLKNIISGAAYQEPDEAELALLRAHALLPLLGPGHEEYYLNLLCYDLHCRAVAELEQLLAPAVPIVIKGLSAALYYNEPSTRTLGDIDFLVRGISVEEAVSVLENNGFLHSLDEVSEKVHSRHISFDKNGIHYELHRYFSGGKTERDAAVDAALSSAEPILRPELPSLHTFPDAENGLVLLSHIQHHLCSEGVGLRQIIDWAFFVKSVLTDEFYASSFQPLLAQTGLQPLAEHLTALTEQYLGTPHRAFSSTAAPETVSLLMEDICSSGNFGRNYDSVSSRTSQFLTTKNPFKRLQQGGLCRWTYAQKHGWVRPFAWIYQIFFIAKTLIVNRLRGNRITGVSEVASRRSRLFRALDL